MDQPDSSEPSFLGFTMAVGLVTTAAAGESKRCRLTASISGAAASNPEVLTGGSGELTTRRGRSPEEQGFIEHGATDPDQIGSAFLDPQIRILHS